MEKELKATISLIGERTGIAFDLYAKTGNRFFTTRPNGTPEQLPENLSHLPFADREANRTYFSVSARKTEFIGMLFGVGKEYDNYAQLISAVLESQPVGGGNRDAEMKNILVGECTKLRVQKFAETYALPKCACFAIAFEPTERNLELSEFLKNFNEESVCEIAETEMGGLALIKFMDGETQSVFRSATEYATLLVNAALMETGINVQVGVGCVVPSFREIATSYRQAETALSLAKTYRVKGQVHTYREFLLIRMLEEIPEYKLKEHFSALFDGDVDSVLSDRDLMNTAEEFLQNSLNVSETSRNLFMHRNTLMYRLDKIEKATGLNIRNFEDAMSFRLLTVMYQILR